MRRPMGQKGAGSVTPRQKDGRIRIAVVMPDGRRVWRSARTPREAERIRRQLVEARELDLDPSRQTLEGFLRSWIDGLGSARNQRVRPRTFQHYEMIVERHITPALGRLTLERLSVGRIQAWLDADPMSPRTVRHHHAVLRRALNVAVRQRLLAYNPAEHVELPKVAADRSDPFTAHEVRRLLESTRDDWLGPLWRVAVMTGLRLGELLGLGWEDIGDATVTVRAQLQRLPPDQGGDVRGWARTPPKAARTLTTIALDADTVAVLDVHRKRQAEARRADWSYWGLVFVTPDGNPYHPSTVLKAFHEACDRAGIRRRRVHDLRGTAATLMREIGVAEDARMARLGHSTSTMARHYAKASIDQDQAAVERLAKAIG